MRFRWRAMVLYNILAIILIGGFILVATFGMMIGMETDEHGIMLGCPFMSDQVSVCPMGAMEHITKWQQLFTAALFRFNLPSSLVLFLSAVVIFLYFHIYIKFILSLFAQSSSFINKNNEQGLILFNYLVIVFSQGILNSRLYA